MSLLYLGTSMAVMALVTYLIRMIPLVLVRKKIKNRFIKSFLHYIPYAVLAAMTFPVIFYSTNSFYSALAGVIVGIVLSLFERGLLTVAVASCAAVFITEFVIGKFF